MKRLIWFTGSSGLDTELDSVRHRYDPDKGVWPAKIAYNINFDKSGRLSRRKGWQYTAVSSDSHSLFCDGGECLFVTGNALCLLNPDFTYTELRNVTVGAKMFYQQVGSKIFYANGSETGFVLDGISYAWTYPDEAYGVKDDTKVFAPPPIGTILSYYNGRMYVIQQYAAFYSEAYNLFTFDLKNYIAFESPITMFRPVQSGIWAGTSSRVAFIKGPGPESFVYDKKGLFGVTPGTDTDIDCSHIGDGSVQGVGVIFAAKRGPYLGTPDGNLIPLADRKLSLPRAIKGAGLYTDKRYIFSLEP